MFRPQIAYILEDVYLHVMLNKCLLKFIYVNGKLITLTLSLTNAYGVFFRHWPMDFLILTHLMLMNMSIMRYVYKFTTFFMVICVI